MSVAFLCNGYQSLDQGDCADMLACNPPLLHPDVINRVTTFYECEEFISRDENVITTTTTKINNNYYYHQLLSSEHEKTDSDDGSKNNVETCFLPFLKKFINEIVVPCSRYKRDTKRINYARMMNPFFRENAMRRNNNMHVNKFYPFTRGQLKYYDRKLYTDIQNLWNEISSWDDPYGSVQTKNKTVMRRHCCCCSRMF